MTSIPCRESLICLVMYAFKCDKQKAESIINGAEQGGTLNDLIAFVSFKQ